MSFDNSKNISYLVHNQRHKWLCILLTISILICSASPVFAIGPNSSLNQVLMAFEAGKNVGEMFALLMGWNQTGTSVEEAILISIAAELQYIFDNSYGYDIVNPYTGVSPTYHVTGKSFGQMLADLNNSLATFGYRFMYNSSTGNSYLYDLYLLTGRMELILGGANGNNITAISGQLSGIGSMLQGNTQNGYLADNIVPTLNSINSYVDNFESNQLSIQNDINNINWNTISPTFKFSTDNVTYYDIDNFTNTTRDRTLYISISDNLQPSQFLTYLRIPFRTTGNVTISYYRSLDNTLTSLNDYNYAVFYSHRNTDLYILPFDIYGNNNYPSVLKLDFNTSYYKSTNGNPELFYKYLTPDQFDYYSVQNLIYNYSSFKQNLDLITAVNDLDQTVQNGDFSIIVPVLNPDVEFNMDVDLSVGDQDDITDLVNDTKDLTETGVTVQQLLDTLDDVLDLFFNQTNKDTIETISTQYHIYY